MPWGTGSKALNKCIIVACTYHKEVAPRIGWDKRTEKPKDGSMRVDICYRLLTDDNAEEMWDSIFVYQDDYSFRSRIGRLLYTLNCQTYNPFIRPEPVMQAIVVGKCLALKVYEVRRGPKVYYHPMKYGYFPIVWNNAFREAYCKDVWERGKGNPYRMNEYRQHEFRHDEFVSKKYEAPVVPEPKKNPFPF